jgi:hypothetical protein
MDALEFFALHHERLHLQVTRDFLQGLSEPQMRLRPQGLNSIAWLVWHMARCEDALNLLLAGRPQVLDAEGWLPRLQLSIRDVGTEMSDDEASDLSARIHLPALRDFTPPWGNAPWRWSARSAPRPSMSSPTWTASERPASSERKPCGRSWSGPAKPRAGG